MLPLYLQVFERVPLRMPLQQREWCTRWPTPAPWANWKHVAVTRSDEGTRRLSVSNSTACKSRPSSEGRVWCTVLWSTSRLTCQGPKTHGSGAAAALTWNLERSSHGISWMPVRPTKTSTLVWGCIIIKLGDRWVKSVCLWVFFPHVCITAAILLYYIKRF